MAINDPQQTEQSAQIWQKQDGHIYEIMKTMCPPNYHHNGFVATHALGHKAIVVITGRAHFLHDCIIRQLQRILHWWIPYVYIYIHINIYIYTYKYIYIYMMISFQGMPHVEASTCIMSALELCAKWQNVSICKLIFHRVFL